MKNLIFVVPALLLLSACFTKEAPSVDQVESLVRSQLGPTATVTSIKKTDVAELIEVVAEGRIFYIDRKAENLIVGHVISRRNFRNLTLKRLDEIHSVDFNSLPLSAAIKQVSGNGERVLVLFEDPNCQYCKKFRVSELAKIENVTIYTLLYPLLGTDSTESARKIWCAEDQLSALNLWSTSGVLPKSISQTCVDPIDDIKAYGKAMHINGTPAFFFADGSRTLGATSSKIIEDRFKNLLSR